MTFWNFGIYVKQTGAFIPPVLALEVSYDAVNWTNIWSYPLSDWTEFTAYYYYYDPTDLYQLEAVDLGAYLGDTIYLGWRLTFSPVGNQAAYLWIVDDIEVCGTQVK